MISQQQLMYLFEYRNGHLIWRRNLPHKSGIKNTRAGYYDSCMRGCCMVTINGKKRQLHRLVYLYHHGIWPVHVYHLDGDSRNNRIENLTTNRNKAYREKLSRLPEALKASEDVKAVFNYKVGELYWKKHSALGRGAAGTKAGYIDKQSGFKVVNFRGKRYQVHRLIYLYHMNEHPHKIYFSDGDKFNTKIQNLSDIVMMKNEIEHGGLDYVLC